MAVAVSSQSSTNFADSTTLTITKPTGVVDNDLLVAIIYGGGLAEINSVPSGWTLIQQQTTSNALELSTYYKVASSEGASWQWGFDASGQVAGVVLRITGHNTLVNIETSAKSSQSNDETPSFTNSVTPSQANSLIIFASGAEQFTDNTPSASSYAIATDNPTWTELLDIASGAGDDALAVAYAIRTATSATGNSSLTWSDNSNNTIDTAGILIVIPPRVDVTVSPSVISATFSVQAPTVTGSAVVSPTVITATFSVQAPTVTIEAPKWVNKDKSSTSWNNQNKS